MLIQLMRRFAVPVVLAVLAVFAAASFGFAQETRIEVQEGGRVRSVVFIVGRDEYFINGQTPGVRMDATPFIEQGRTFVPIRYLAYGLGVAKRDVLWDGRLRKVTLKKGEAWAELVVGWTLMRSSSGAKVMDVAPVLRRGRTYLPARHVAEALEYQIEYEKDEKGWEYVYCWPRGQEPPLEDLAAVKKYVNTPVQSGVGFPENAVRVYSPEATKVEVPHIDLVDFQKAEVYEAVVLASDLPQPCDELGMVYKLEVDRAKFTQYEAPAIRITVDRDEPVDLILVARGGKDVRYRQVHDSYALSDGKYVLMFCPNELGEKLDGLPLLKLEDVDYFALSTVGVDWEGVCGVLYIRNPYRSCS